MATQDAALSGMVARRGRSTRGLFIMVVLILGFGFWIIYPIVLTLVMSFNAAPLGQEPVWTLANWVKAWTDPGAFPSLWNTIKIYLLNTVIGFPIAILVSWALARTKMPHSHGLEFMFWVSFMLPNISTTVGWTYLLERRPFLPRSRTVQHLQRFRHRFRASDVQPDFPGRDASDAGLP
jgi:ABC-type spermidine/putrescine transport system permease subunit II